MLQMSRKFLALSVPRYKVYVDLLNTKDQLFNDSLQTLVDSLGLYSKN